MLSSLLLSMLTGSAALAADLPVPNARYTQQDDVSGSAIAEPGKAAKERKTRKARFEVSFRGRWLVAPDAIFDAWFENDTPDYPWALRQDSPNGADSPYCAATPTSTACGDGRPSISAYSGGLELLVKFNRDTVIFYGEWVQSQMGAGLWDDKESGDRAGVPDFEDGDYLVPGNNFGLVAFGVNYQADIPLVKLDRTNGAFGMDFTAGAGLGLLAMVGQLDRYDSDDGPLELPAYEQFDNGQTADPDDQVGRFWPAVDVNLGFKFNFADRCTLRIEGGLHTLLYAGATLGFKI